MTPQGDRKKEMKRGKKNMPFSYACHLKCLLDCTKLVSLRSQQVLISVSTLEIPNPFRKTEKTAWDDVNLCTCYSLLVKILLFWWLCVLGTGTFYTLRGPTQELAATRPLTHEEQWTTNLGRRGEHKWMNGVVVVHATKAKWTLPCHTPSSFIFFTMSNSARHADPTLASKLILYYVENRQEYAFLTHSLVQWANPLPSLLLEENGWHVTSCSSCYCNRLH